MVWGKLLLVSLLFAFSLSQFDDKCRSHTVRTIIFPEGPVTAVHYCAPDYKIIFAAVSTYIYRSENAGLDWNRLANVNATEIIPTADPSQVFFFHPDGKLYVTKDYAKAITPIGQTFEVVEPHPRVVSWVLGLKRECDTEDVCRLNLYISVDSGIHWTFLRDTVFQVAWENSGSSGNIHYLGAQKSTIQDFTLLNYSYFYATGAVSGSLSVVQTVENIGGMLAFPPYIFLAQLIDAAGDTDLLVNDADGAPFDVATFPFGHLRKELFTILEANRGSVFLNVAHDTTSAYNWGHTYVTDSFSDPYFRSSLTYTSRGWNSVDFAKIRGVEGVYIANRYSVDPHQPTISMDTKQQTYISFHSGQPDTWQRLSKPEDPNTTCETDECNLNLLGPSSGLPSFYSSSTASGLIIAPGTTADSVNQFPESLANTYFSRDAGKTWQMIHPNLHQYMFLDHGSVITLLKHDSDTKSYTYSWNEGLSWHDCPFDVNISLAVVELHTSPNPIGLSMLVRGETTRNRKRVGVLVLLDFADLHSSLCSEADYEYWYPQGASVCVLGQNITYRRRKRDRECFNGENANVTINQICPCTMDDYECDNCFEKKPNNKCEPIKTPTCQAYIENLQTCSGRRGKATYFSNLTGYFLPARNKCDPNKAGAVNLISQTSPCRSRVFGGGSGAIRVLFVFLALVSVALVAIIVVVILRRRNERFRTITDGYYQSFLSCIRCTPAESTNSDRSSDYTPVNRHDPDDFLDEESNSLGRGEEETVKV